MLKSRHEVRDPIHVFVRLVTMNVTYWIRGRFNGYATFINWNDTSFITGATHRRFEHSLGVMELASRVFDVVTDPNKVTDEIKELLPELGSEEKRGYWQEKCFVSPHCVMTRPLALSSYRRREILPKGWDHERLTGKIIATSLEEFLGQIGDASPDRGCGEISIGTQEGSCSPRKTSSATRLELTAWTICFAILTILVWHTASSITTD